MTVATLTTMTDISCQSTVPPPIPSSVVPLSSAAGTLSAPVPTFEKDPYAWDEAQGDDDDWSEDDEDQSCKEKPWLICVEHKATRERMPILPPMVSYGSSPELHSDWSGVPITTTDDWEQIYNAALKRDDFALGYIAYLNSTFQRPTKFRTAGITHLIQGYGALAKMCCQYVLHSRTWRKINKQSLDMMTSFGKFLAKTFITVFYEFMNSTIFI
jgi:hypothetical protein